MESLKNKRYVMPANTKTNIKTSSDFSEAFMNDVWED